jgi:prophage endopeptidase
MIPNPWVILAVLLALAGFYGYGHHKGWDDRDAEMQAEIAIKNEEARAKEQELTKQINDQSYKLQEANNAITQKQTDITKLINSGRVRLQATGCVQANASTAPASGDRNTEGSESDRATLLAIAEIVAQGDRNTAQLNQCIQAYNKVMESVNGQR